LTILYLVGILKDCSLGICQGDINELHREHWETRSSILLHSTGTLTALSAGLFSFRWYIGIAFSLYFFDDIRETGHGGSKHRLFDLSKQELAPRLFSNVGGTMAGLSLSAEMSFSPALYGFCIGFNFGNKKQDSILMYLCFVLDFLSS
jgi:hypothetical protein